MSRTDRAANVAGAFRVETAARAEIPYSLSTMGTRSIEEVAAVSDGDKWFQVYTWKDRSLVTFASFFGTFLSLSAWLTALKIGHIGSLAAVGSFNPVAASLWEWVLLRKRPTPYLIAALALFLAGFFPLLGD